MGVTYATSKSEIASQLRAQILDVAEEEKKPWELVHDVRESSDFTEEEAREALKKLTLDGELQIESTGKVRAAPSHV